METRTAGLLIPGEDDAPLLKLAQRQAVPLMSVLRHASAMTPLIVPTIIGPTVWAVWRAPVDESVAQAGLEALAISSGSLPVSGTLPFETWTSSWGLIGSLPISLLFPGWLFTVLLLGAFTIFGRRLESARYSLISLFLLVHQSLILMQSQSARSLAPGLFFGWIAVWGVIEHYFQGERWYGWRLILSAIAAALCAISGGPLVIPIWLSLSLWIFMGVRWNHCPVGDTPGNGKVGECRKAICPIGWIFWTGLFCVGTLALIVAYIPRISGEEWWQGNPLDRASWQITDRFLWSLPILLMLAWIGSFSKDGRDGLRSLWVIWAAVTAVFLILQRVMFVSAQRELGTLISLILPLSCLATRGLIQILDRRAHVSTVIISSAIALYWVGIFVSIDKDISGYLLLAVILMHGAFLGSLAWWSTQHADRSDSEARALLRILLLSIAVLYLTLGLMGLKFGSRQDKDLVRWSAELARLQETELIWLLSEGKIPPQIEFLTRRRWPNAQILETHSWDPILSNTDFQSGLIVAWEGIRSLPANPNLASQVEAVLPARVFRRGELNVFRRLTKLESLPKTNGI